MASPASTSFLSPILNNRRCDTNAYYEEMKPAFVLLRIFGLMPYHVTSEGKSHLVSVTQCYEIYTSCFYTRPLSTEFSVDFFFSNPLTDIRIVFVMTGPLSI
jgi:hypothetical protein